MPAGPKAVASAGWATSRREHCELSKLALDVVSRSDRMKHSGIAAALLLLLGLSAAAGQVSDAGDGLLDTSSMSFYGFYGFYGFPAEPDLRCEIVSIKFNLYNYGAQDLTYVSTIQYIIDGTKAAIDATYLQAVPTGSSDDYRVEVTELSGSEVTYVTVSVDVLFVHNPAGNSYSKSSDYGGAFAKYLGVAGEDEPNNVTDAPTSGVSSIGLDLVVMGYDEATLADANEKAAFEATLTAAMQAAVFQTYGSSVAAEGVSVQTFGVSDEGTDSDPAVAVRIYVHFEKMADIAAQFLSDLVSDPYQFGDNYGVLSGKIKVVEAVDVTADTMMAADSRKLLQNAVVGDDSTTTNHLVTGIAAAGLGVASIEEGGIVCKNSPVSSFYGVYGFDSASAAIGGSSGGAGGAGSAGGAGGYQSADGSFNPRGGSASAVAGGSSGVAGGSSGVLDSDEGFYGTTSFYGTSFYGTSFYGTSFYGEDSVVVGSSATQPGSSAADMSFYGYSPVAAPKPESPSPSGGSPPGPRPTESPVTPTTIPVYFTSILSDYDMADLTGPDMAAFRQDYTAAVENAVRLLGITSDPQVSIQDVRAGSVAVDTVVTFVDDVSGSELLMQVLAQNPSLAFPAFSSLGSITISDVYSGEDGQTRPEPPIGRPEPERPSTDQCDQMDRYGDCCPTTLDAKLECCSSGAVDECGVCGGDGSTCALSALVRVSTPARPGLDDPSSDAFQAMLADFKEGMASLFTAFNIDATAVEVDATAVTSAAGANGDITLDIPFRMYPSAANGVTVPTVPRATSILTSAAASGMTYQDITIVEVLDVSRRGVCDNGICEIGEMLPVAGSLPEDLCAQDCPGVVSCPVGSAADLVGERYSTCTGNGACVQSSGECRCNTGYAGENCGQCANAFVAQDGKCVAIATEEDVQELEKEITQTSSDNTQRDIILGVVFGIIALILISLGMYWMLVLRKRRAGAREEGLAFSSQQQVPASNEEPDIPTRQLAENTV
eukprot:jgi/Tetstr1/446187/TSEL_003588.t1